MGSSERVISMVPSWTETLIECGVQVVGRTRYCLHPSEVVQHIPVVGGTKDVRWSEVGRLGGDLLVLDQEENPRRMAELAPLPYIATHVTSVRDLPTELTKLHAAIGAPALQQEVLAWQQTLAKVSPRVQSNSEDSLGAWLQLPGVTWWRAPKEQKNFIYIIWRRPWMAVARATFIGSMLAALGFGERQVDFPSKYPEIDLKSFSPAQTVLLFSTEPYDFAKEREELLALGFACGLINGESYSWFGRRARLFLDAHLL